PLPVRVPAKSVKAGSLLIASVPSAQFVRIFHPQGPGPTSAIGVSVCDSQQPALQSRNRPASGRPGAGVAGVFVSTFFVVLSVFCTGKTQRKRLHGVSA